ncbi:hypothetical protein D3C72_1299690 [compost metagenome]
MLAVNLDDRQLQPRDAHIEDGHGPRADEAQSHPLTAAEQARPVADRVLTVHQVGVDRARDVEHVRGVHAHLHPHEAILHRGL